jgi:hypothetical protein
MREMEKKFLGLVKVKGNGRSLNVPERSRYQCRREVRSPMVGRVVEGKPDIADVFPRDPRDIFLGKSWVKSRFEGKSDILTCATSSGC